MRTTICRSAALPRPPQQLQANDPPTAGRSSTPSAAAASHTRGTAQPLAGVTTRTPIIGDDSRSRTRTRSTAWLPIGVTAEAVEDARPTTTTTSVGVEATRARARVQARTCPAGLDVRLSRYLPDTSIASSDACRSLCPLSQPLLLARYTAPSSRHLLAGPQHRSAFLLRPSSPLPITRLNRSNRSSFMGRLSLSHGRSILPDHSSSTGRRRRRHCLKSPTDRSLHCHRLPSSSHRRCHRATRRSTPSSGTTFPSAPLRRCPGGRPRSPRRRRRSSRSRRPHSPAHSSRSRSPPSAQPRPRQTPLASRRFRRRPSGTVTGATTPPLASGGSARIRPPRSTAISLARANGAGRRPTTKRLRVPTPARGRRRARLSPRPAQPAVRLRPSPSFWTPPCQQMPATLALATCSTRRRPCRRRRRHPRRRKAQWRPPRSHLAGAVTAAAGPVAAAAAAVVAGDTAGARQTKGSICRPSRTSFGSHPTPRPCRRTPIQVLRRSLVRLLRSVPASARATSLSHVPVQSPASRTASCWPTRSTARSSSASSSSPRDGRESLTLLRLSPLGSFIFTTAWRRFLASCLSSLYPCSACFLVYGCPFALASAEHVMCVASTDRARMLWSC